MKSYLKISFFIVSMANIIIFITGCGGGGSVNNAITVVQRVEKIAIGWDFIKKGDPYSAETKFRGALRDYPDDEEIRDIYCGLGWALGGQKKWDESLEYFQKVSGSSTDGLIGTAGVLLARGDEGDIAEAIKHLNRAGMTNPEGQLKSEHNLPFSTAEGHALLAACYILQGQDDSAIIQAEAAKRWDASWSNTSVEIIHNAILTDLGLGTKK